MSLTLYYHPLSAFCHKVLIALYELDLPFEPRLLDLGDSLQRADFLALWPTGKIPLLVDGDRVVPETSIIIEHLVRQHADGDSPLVPRDHEASLEARLMDRVIDLYLMQPMQAIVGDRLRAEADRDPIAVDRARQTLSMAYGLIEQRLGARPWIAGEQFSLADCAAAPALFYATTLVPLPPACSGLAACFERLLQRPSVARTLREAQPYLRFYPFHDAIPARFLPPPSAA